MTMIKNDAPIQAGLKANNSENISMNDTTQSFDSRPFIDRYGLWTPQQKSAASEVIKSIEENNIEVVRVSFVDQHGILRGKTIAADALASCFRSGVTMTSTLLLKDTSHRTVFPIWKADAGFGDGAMTGASDLVMVPDPLSFKILPWAAGNGWMLSDLYNTDGSVNAFSTRGLLAKSVAELELSDRQFITGLEVEFYVFKALDVPLNLEDAGQPGAPPKVGLISQGYQYLTEDIYDQLEDVFALIRKNARALGLPVRSFEVEFGPSQCEVTFEPQQAMRQADTMILFRSMVKQVCRRNGLHATFMCRPRFKEAMASGWHLHQSVIDSKTGNNLFTPEEGVISDLGHQWIAGLLQHARESCLFSTPTINGYKRYREFSLAPDRIQWGRDNRGATLRVLSGPGDPASRIENRVGEPAANPYLYMLSQVVSGMDGIKRGLESPPAVNNPYDSDAVRLPRTLLEALQAFRESKFYRETLGDAFVDYYSIIKQAEWDRFMATVTDWEENEYLSIF
jgi:glutamine synthetase